MGWFTRLMVLLLVLAAIAGGAALYWGYAQQQVLTVRVATLEKELASVKSELASTKSKLQAMEQDSVGTMVKRANEVIVKGWDAIVDSVESELSRARDALQHLDQSSSSDGVAPDPAEGNSSSSNSIEDQEPAIQP
ncbi:hypothetical protein [Gilvimarinus algae]|uniref:Uncharacterized protein n=1 Tax=Gilvimarinus algae TaxID=3058037 RepID=A0ABT8TFM8_9GAMM|nr:hypothetical protein [Gilvimarinus sp. SDUM040014]MDO3382193.1 hypothetical protein [Gilvimarinus sp. SDUM040014]